MPRVQVGYDPAPEGVRVNSGPYMQAVQARNDPLANVSPLVQSLAQVNPGLIAQAAQNANETFVKPDADEATRYANSMTMEELGKKLKSGEMLPSQSPVFRATVEHIYGYNNQQAFERDTLSKIERGELRFNTQEDLDKYLTEKRNEQLAGASKFQIAGFDKGYGKFKDAVIGANTKKMDSEYVADAVGKASETLRNVLTESTQGEYDPEQAAQKVISTYAELRRNGPLRDPKNARNALNGLMYPLLEAGNVEVVEKLMKSKLDDGISVYDALGAQHAQAIISGTERKRIQMMQEQQAAVLADQAQKSQADAQSKVYTAVAGGTFTALPTPKVITPKGEQKDADREELGGNAVREYIKNNNMPFDKQVRLWSSNDLTNDDWKREVQGGIQNIASVGWTYDGKNVGQLNDQGKKSLQMFQQINTTNPEYARKMAGSDDNYKMLSNIQFMQEYGGFPDVSQAAQIVNLAKNRGLKASDAGMKQDQLNAATDDVVAGGLIEQTTTFVKSIFGQDNVPNLLGVKGIIRERAEILLMSGQLPDAKSAVEATVKYLSNPAVTTKVNNTLYMNSDLPPVPEGANRGDWFDKFITAGPKQIAIDQKLKPTTIRLEPGKNGIYTAWAGNVPLQDSNGQMVMYNREQIRDWIAREYDHEMEVARQKAFVKNKK